MNYNLSAFLVTQATGNSFENLFKIYSNIRSFIQSLKLKSFAEKRSSPDLENLMPSSTRNTLIRTQQISTPQLTESFISLFEQTHQFKHNLMRESQGFFKLLETEHKSLKSEISSRFPSEIQSPTKDNKDADQYEDTHLLNFKLNPDAVENERAKL